MRRKFLAAALILALAVALCPAALAVGKLSTPTDLAWGYDRHGTDGYSAPYPGAMSWRFGENNTGMVRLTIYKDNKKLVSEDTGFALRDESLGDSLPAGFYGTIQLDEILTRNDIPLDSGTYYFTVQGITDWGSTSSNNSAVATSPPWTYTKPAAQLSAPTAPVWDFPYCTWQSERDITQWQESTVYFYYSKTKNGTYDFVGMNGNYNYYSPNKTTVDEVALEYCGAGYYKFRVMDVSQDITQWQNSPWSPFSEPYYYDGSPVDICHHYDVDFRNEKDATCTQDGYTGDYVCADCGEIQDKGEVIPALGHVIDSDGWCWYCNQRLEYYGTLGDSGQLAWTYSIETGAVTFEDSIPQNETVLAACYNSSGRFTGAKLVDRWSMEAQVGTSFATMKLFWLDAKKAPKCQAVELTPDL